MTHLAVSEIVDVSTDVEMVEAGRRYPNAGILNHGRGLFKKAELDGTETSYRTLHRLHEGDLVYSRLFGWEGSVAVVPTEFDGYYVSPEFPVLRPRPSVALSNYLAHIARWPDFHEKLAGLTTGMGNRRQRVQLERFLSVEIPLPPIDEQRRITDEIDGWRSREAQLRSKFPANDVVANLIPAAVDSVLRRNAASWAPLGELVDCVNDLVRPGEDPAPAEVFVGLQHVESHTGRRTGWLELGQEKGRKFRFAARDVVYGYLRPYLNKVWVADRSGLCSVDQYVLRPKPSIPAEYVAFALRSRTTLEEAKRLTHSLQLPRLRSGLLLGIEVPLPERAVNAVVAELDDAMRSLVSLRETMKRRGELLDALEPAVLNRAFAAA